MAIDKDSMTIGAVAGDVWYIVVAAHNLDAPADRPDGVEQNRVVNLFGLVPDFLLQLHGGFECAVRTQRINRSGEGTFCVRGTNALLRPLESRLK
ncbi:MAG: hypothetical protein ACTHJS_12835 [Xanthobacteraceae bacterium]